MVVSGQQAPDSALRRELSPACTCHAERPQLASVVASATGSEVPALDLDELLLEIHDERGLQPWASRERERAKP